VRTNVYVDGFNLYYGALKAFREYRWLDLGKLSQLLVGNHYEVGHIRYFTALVRGRANNPKQRLRQDIYLRALRTIPHLTLHYGTFQAKPKKMPLAHELPKIRLVEVMKTEEKGSDVNLATYLLLDAFRGDFDSALVISNDSDLKEPIRVVKSELGKRVGIANPDLFTPRALKGDFFRQIRPSHLKSCQFPEVLKDKNGTITRPPEWA
jgi:hypothetical protein